MLKTFSCYNGMDENEAIVDYSRKKLRKVPQEALVRGQAVEELYLDSNSIEILPKEVFSLSKLRILSVSDNNLSKLSTHIGNLDRLEKLDVSKNGISCFPDSIASCIQLAQLDGSVNSIVKLSDGLISLSNLTHLTLNETFLECLPENFGRLSRLKVLELRHNYLQTLPKSICNLKELERLDIGENKFLHLPVAVGHLISLQELLADGNLIEEIPPVIGLLSNLAFLELSKNNLESLPPEMEELKNLTDIYLSVNELLELPENIGSLSNLQTLKLDENDLIFLPSSIGRLHSLEELDVATNNLEGLPCTVGHLKMLRILTLDNNCIKSLPAELGDCTSLSLLSLHSNELINVPETLGGLRNLQVINLSGNMLTSLPLSFLNLKNLRALWLSKNQSKPVVPLIRKYNEGERKYTVSCSLLPQNPWDNDEIQHQDKQSSDENSISSINEDKDDLVDGKESVVRTRGSISASLISGNKKDEGDEEEQFKPWYEQEFIESAGNSDYFPPNEELNDKSLSTEGSYNLNQASIAFQSRVLFKEEPPSSISQLSDTTFPSSTSLNYEDQRSNDSSSEGTGTDKTTFSMLEGSSSSVPLSCSAQIVSPKTGAVGISRGSLNHNEKKSLADTVGDINIDDVCGNTSSIAQPNKTDKGSIDHSFELVSLDDNMRLRFNNKRQRDGNAICQYEAFKPTRFNLYQDSNAVSWSAAVAKDLPDASPMIKKKSVTLKDNPLISSSLARDESPRSRRGGDYATNPKFEEKIRVLQQQRLKERSRRRETSARVEYCSEQREFSKPPPTSPPRYVEDFDDDSDLRSAPARLPSNDYRPMISDEGDSVAIKLGDFVLVSPKEAFDRQTNSPAQIYKTAVTAAGRIRQRDESSPPVETRHFNGFTEQQQHRQATPHFDNVQKRSPYAKNSGVLQATAVPDEARQSKLDARRAATLSAGVCKVGVDRGEGERRNGNIRDNITAGIEQKEHLNQANRSGHPILPGNNGHLTARQSSVPLLSPSHTVQHVTVKSSKIDQPLSPRLVMAVDGRNGNQDVAFKQFLPGCAVEDVTSFLVNNFSGLSPTTSKQDCSSGEHSPNAFKTAGDRSCSDQNKNSAQFIQEQVSVDCDVEEVTRNISQHLSGFSKVQNVESAMDITSQMRVHVTDLDMPDAACPLSRNLQPHDKKFEENAEHSKHKNVQVIPIPTGQKEEVYVRVYRSPILGFSIGGGVETGTNVTEGIYVVDVKPGGPSSHLLKPGDRILEVNKLNLRSVSHEHAVLFLTHNQQLDLLIERVRHE